ncbi:MAG: diacylglycerol kinase family protein [Candidatus Pacearchaeota archaeon]|nr:diacylglycerol kinase family protein [Candidatus Pacearchaeota archaeon]
MTRVSFTDSTFCAIKGLLRLFSGERNIKMQILISAIVIFSSFLLNVSNYYKLIIAVIFFMGIVLELFNTNIERLIDIISPEYNKELGRIKDSMAGIVLLTFIVAMIVSLFILFNKMLIFWNDVSRNIFLVLMIASNVVLLCFIFLAVYIKNKN